MTAFFITVFTIYFLLLVLLITGWNKFLRVDEHDHQRHHLISVIVPFRNEASNLPALVTSLRQVNYPPNKFEVILIDDGSTDNSMEIARQCTAGLANFKIMSADSSGKKKTIAKGIRQSIGEIIVTTDADCEVPREWLKSIDHRFQDQSIRMVAGVVRIKQDESFFSRLQTLEFASLIGSAASGMTLGFPMMCNGANLAYRKEAFKEVNGFEGNEEIASGDDEFLMRKITSRFGVKSLKFLNDNQAIVTTRALRSVQDFFSQRIRWAGKWKYNSSWLTRALAIFVWVFQITWLAALATLFFQPVNNTIAWLIFVKVVMEGFFLNIISKFMTQKFSVITFLALQVAYPVYVMAVGVLSNVVHISWKDRSI